jgi:hypothetical protein
MSLAVSRNSLTSLEGVELMERLSTLNISYNKIVDMSELLRMRGLHQVVELDLRMNPVCKQESYRLFVIKYLPRLKRLDGKDISTAERARSERLFSNLDYTSSSSDGESVLDRDRRRARDEKQSRSPQKSHTHASSRGGSVHGSGVCKNNASPYMSDDSEDDDLDFVRVTARRRAAAAARSTTMNGASPESPTNSLTFVRTSSASTLGSSSASTPVKSSKEAVTARNMAGMSAIDRRRQLLSAPSSSSWGHVHTHEHTNDPRVNALTPRQMAHAHTSRGGGSNNERHDADSHDDDGAATSSSSRTVHAHTPKRLHTDAPTDSPHDHSTHTPSMLGSDSHMKASHDHHHNSDTHQQRQPQYYNSTATVTGGGAAATADTSSHYKRLSTGTYQGTQQQHTPGNQRMGHTPKITPHTHTTPKIEQSRGAQQTQHEYSNNTPNSSSSMRQTANIKWTRALEEALQDEYRHHDDTHSSSDANADSRTTRMSTADRNSASSGGGHRGGDLNSNDDGYASKRGNVGAKPTQIPVSTDSKSTRGGHVHTRGSSRSQDDDDDDDDDDGTDRHRQRQSVASTTRGANQDMHASARRDSGSSGGSAKMPARDSGSSGGSAKMPARDSGSSGGSAKMPARTAADVNASPPLSIGSLHHKYSAEKNKARAAQYAGGDDGDHTHDDHDDHGDALQRARNTESLMMRHTTRATTPVNAKHTSTTSGNAKSATPTNASKHTHTTPVHATNTTPHGNVGEKNAASRQVKMHYRDSDSDDASDDDDRGTHHAGKGSAKVSAGGSSRGTSTPVMDRQTDRQTDSLSSLKKYAVGGGRRGYGGGGGDVDGATPVRVVDTMKHTYRRETDSPLERQSYEKGLQQSVKTPQQRLQQTPQRSLRKGAFKEDVSGIVYDALDVLGCGRYV